MLLTRGTAIFAAGCLLLSACIANGRPERKASSGKNPECTKVPVGTWLMNHYLPPSPGEPLAFYATSIVRMKEIANNVYTGKSVRVYFLHYQFLILGEGSELYYWDSVPGMDWYQGAIFYFHIGALFNPTTCVLSGIAMNVFEEAMFADAVEFVYNGTVLEGVLIASNAPPDSPDSSNRVLTPFYLTFNATFLYPPPPLP